MIVITPKEDLDNIIAKFTAQRRDQPASEIMNNKEDVLRVMLPFKDQKSPSLSDDNSETLTKPLAGRYNLSTRAEKLPPISQFWKQTHTYKSAMCCLLSSIDRFRSRTRTSKTTLKWRAMPMYGYATAFGRHFYVIFV